MVLIKDERSCHVQEKQLSWCLYVHLHCHLAQVSSGVRFTALGRAETQSLQRMLQSTGKPKCQARLVR